MHKKKGGVLRDRTYKRCRNGEIHQSKNYNIQTFLSFLNFEGKDDKTEMRNR